MNKLSTLDWVTIILVIVGGINWGLVGLFNFNLVDTIFMAGSIIGKIVYILVGLSAVYVLMIVGKLKK